MFLSHIEIENYRTFRHVGIDFNESMNYIVGDNNIGKSNFLDLLETTLSGCGFREGDFLDPNQPIRVVYTLSMGDTGQDESVSLTLAQSIHEAMPVLVSGVNGETLPLEYIRRMYYIPHSLSEATRRGPDQEQTADMAEALELFLEEETERGRVESILSAYGLPVDLSGPAESAAIHWIRAVYEGSWNMGRGRSTIQVMLAVGAYILAVLYRKKQSRAVPFEEIVMTDKRGKRYLPILLSVDEPEHHLHPYMQRAVLAFLRRILSNKEPLFVKILKTVLGIDGLDGQIFVVTHSTDALVNDYRAIVRLYRDGAGNVEASSGAVFHFDQELEKHLIMHFPEVKEALFSRCAILVEGETEYGSFGYFAHRLGGNLDFYGICLINARGESSISRIMQLLRRFHIPAVALYDRDVQNGHRPSASVFYTNGICYEMDVVETCLSRGRRDLLNEVVHSLGEERAYVSASLVKKACQKLGIAKGVFPPRKLGNISDRDKRALSFYYFAWFYGNKGVITGRALGIAMKRDDIPRAFRRVVEAAVKKTKC